MTRRLANWLESYADLASISEAPRLFHFWSGVSAIAGALRRHVWFDQTQFVWYPGFYIVFVGDPGIVNKSTATGYAMHMLQAVPGIHFGPDEITWQQLVTSFAKAYEDFEIDGEWIPQSAFTIYASEFGMLMDFKDAKFVNLLITMWDGLKGFKKETKTSGEDSVNSPFINLIACTTPQWINTNMDANTIGGGFTSRCVFVFGEKKEKYVAYLEDAVLETGRTLEQHHQLREDLVADLEHISTAVKGKYVLTKEAKEWGKAWYEALWTNYSRADPDYVNNYKARKQAHVHKLAMILAASKRDALVIERRDLEMANVALTTTEEQFSKVFSKVGQSADSLQVDKLLAFLEAKGEVKYSEAYRYVQTYFPNHKEFEGILAGVVRAGFVVTVAVPGDLLLRWTGTQP